MTHRLTMIALLSLTACAGTWQQQATRYGMVAKEIVDTGAKVVSAHVEDMADKCERHDDLKAYVGCLGPIAGRPDETMAVFESVRAAQLGLYVAVAAGNRELTLQALVELKDQLAKAAALVTAAKEKR